MIQLPQNIQNRFFSLTFPMSFLFYTATVSGTLCNVSLAGFANMFLTRKHNPVVYMQAKAVQKERRPVFPILALTGCW